MADAVAMPTHLIVYHDGSCPLCRLEIGHYRRQKGAERIAFVDVSDPEASAGAGLSRHAAMARFHVRRPSGDLLDGAPAFVAVWEQLSSWRWAWRLATLPGATEALDLGYTLFLPARPLFARLAAQLEPR